MDLIYSNRYREICDYTWDDYDNPQGMINELPSGIWHVDTASISNFFSVITNKYNRNKKYVVISPSCDFGVCLQQYNHPARDLEKWVSMQISNGFGYNDLQMPARLKQHQCNENDKYSIKCWSFTEATFDEIPPNVVRWFLVNCDIKHERVVAIPFGIFGNKDSLDRVNKIDTYFDNRMPIRKKLLYVNFQFYTIDRARLYHCFSNIQGVTCKKDVSFNEYVDDLATHKFVLCPTGNGLDCYRTLETIYMGAIPILENKVGATFPYRTLMYPMLCYDHLLMTPLQYLPDMYSQMNKHWKKSEIDLERIYWPYWKNRIEKCRSEL